MEPCLPVNVDSCCGDQLVSNKKQKSQALPATRVTYCWSPYVPLWKDIQYYIEILIPCLEKDFTLDFN